MNSSCLYCAEEIQAGAEKCQHCGEYQAERGSPATSGKRGLLIGLAVVVGVVGLCIPAAGVLLFAGIRVAPAPPVQVFSQPTRKIAFKRGAQKVQADVAVNLENSDGPSIASVFGGHRYVFVSAPGVSWEEAKTRCEANGGALAVVDSPEEQSFLVDLVAREGGGAAWTGLEGPELLQGDLGDGSALALSAAGYVCEWAKK